MALITDLSGTFTRDELLRLKFPVAWSGTKDAAEAKAEEEALRELADEALGQLDEHYTHAGDGETDYAVRIEAGEVVEIVEA